MVPQLVPAGYRWLMSHVASPSAPPGRIRRMIKKFMAWSRWKQLGAIIFFLAGVAGIVSGVAAVWPKDETSIETLLFQATPVTGAFPSYAIPVTAPFESFPSNKAACGEEQKDWFEAHGTPYSETYLLRFRNAAKAGSQLAVRDISSEGDRFEPEIPEVSVTCESSQGGKGEAIAGEQAQLNVGVSDLATYMTGLPKSAAQTQSSTTPEMTVEYKLEPGEPVRTYLNVTSDRNFRGNFVAVAISGKNEKKVTAEIDGGQKVFVPSFSQTKMWNVIVMDGNFICRDMAKDGLSYKDSPCSISELKSRASLWFCGNTHLPSFRPPGPRYTRELEFPSAISKIDKLSRKTFVVDTCPQIEMFHIISSWTRYRDDTSVVHKTSPFKG